MTIRNHKDKLGASFYNIDEFRVAMYRKESTPFGVGYSVYIFNYDNSTPKVIYNVLTKKKAIELCRKYAGA